MDYLNIDRQLLEQLAEITASVERINNAEMAHPLDKDLLLSQIKDLYATALKIEAKAEEHKEVESAEDFVQEGPQTFDPSKTEVAPQAEEPVAEPETPTVNTDFESLEKPEDSIPKPEPTPEPEPELPQDDEPEISPELENMGETELYGPLPEEFKELEPLESDEEETPEPELEPGPVHEPTPEEKADVAERVMNRKNAIENLVSQQHTITSATKAPEMETPSSTESQPQFSLFDYMPGASRVVENIAPAPQKPVVEPTPEPQPQASTIINPAPTPAPAPVAPQQTPVAPVAPKYTDLRSIIGINDKFTFINDLFEKDMRNYNEFINTLNKIEDLDEARSFVQQNATLHNWDKESMAVQLFMSVYKRRYSTPLILL